MIHVCVDLSEATPDEISAFLALPGVGRAMDSLSQIHPEIRLRLDQPVPVEDTIERLEPVAV